MSRNYEKENEWSKQKYRQVSARIDKNLADEFFEKLDKPYATWLKAEIEKYLKKN